MPRQPLVLSLLLLVLASPFAPCAFAQDQAARITSPDGRIEFRVWSEDGAPRYAVTQDDTMIVRASRLGFRFADSAPLEDDLTLATTQTDSHDESWEQPWGERRIVRDHHNELVASFRRENNPELGFDLRIRVFDSGVGFRYEVIGEAQHAIVDEITRINLPEHSTAWWIPAAGWNRYEYLYQETPLSEVDRAHSPFTVRLPEEGPWVAIHEAALHDYSGFYLDQARGGILDIKLAPGSDGIAVHAGAEFTTPWRTIQIADEAVGLINSDIILNLNEPNVLGDVSWVEPGKYVGIWWGMHINTQSWGSGPIHGATNENTREMIDFAAENGFSGVLVEGWNLGWDGDWFNREETFSFTEAYPDFDIEALAAYARERGVRLVGHHETSGDLTNYENQMDAGFALYNRLGIAQVKTGYVADQGDLVRYDEDGTPRYEWHYGQYAVNHHLSVIQNAARHQISINAHEPVKDTGIRRTYPNAISREGARGQEYNAWGQPPNPPEHTSMLAFTRMLSGPMDFTPGIFDLIPREDSASRVEATLARQLALYVVLYSPIQMAADLPENYRARPDAFQFIRDVPTDWEESIALQGAPGELIVFSRQERGGQDWYLGAATDEEARQISVPLDFLEAGRSYEAQIYRDGENADWESNPYAITIERQQVSHTDALDLPLAPGGGAAIRFRALED
ncbi:MAG: glycoside hydrolase family 97 protein [Maricaulis sp.]|uniref:glycoside hydrolase family 97 protein n=1 Tax=Maricaulis sp. TaxID=1486257 RepID=UPI0026179FBD|nr:glycoside hydrolase family 97 protein [Maricaulis sp.]MDM7984168.1 glycoside hydrolase family 97 protein [Maricaulis sp.]